MVTFEHPEYWLLLIPIAFAFWLAAKYSDAPLTRDQIAQSLAVRCLAAALVIAAIAGPLLRANSRAQCVAFLIDVSRSISPAARSAEFGMVRRALAAKPRNDSAAVIEFASDPAVLTTPSTSPQAPDDQVGVNDESTDIGAAIRTASAVIPHGASGQIVLLTDGNETNGSALQAAGDAGLPVGSVDPASFLGKSPPEASVAHVDLPAQVHDGEPTEVRSVIDSTVAQTAAVTVKVGGGTVKTQSVALAPGHNLVISPITLTGSGLREVEVDVDAPDDTMLENNRGLALTDVIGRPRILYITDNPDQVSATLQRAMKAQSIELDLEPAIDAPTDVAGFAAYDGVVISNTPASELTIDQQNALQSAVRDFGVGLGMVGGIDSYIGGGWAETPIEEALPVKMAPREGEKMPAADIVVVLDASGSMALEEDGVEKVQLAARAAVSLLGALQPNDRVAVIAVTTVPVTVLPFSKPKDALAAKADIEGVTAGGGGIYCLVGLQAAYDMLDSSKAPIKHVVICPDTNDSEQQEHCVDLARTMRLTENVTTSVCGIGQWTDKDVGFQQSLADAGGGQAFVVTHATDLPQFFQRDVSHFQAPPYSEHPFKPSIDSSDKVLAGLSAVSEPPLLGYNIVTARPGAVVSMRAPGEPDPIFAHESYGLGRTFAFTSDETDHWAARWLQWPGYEQFWAQALRWSLRGAKPADFEAFADIGPGGAGHIVVDAFAPDGSYLNGASFTAMRAAPDGQTARIALDQTAPGRYEAQFPIAETGAYLITVSRYGAPEDGEALLGLAQSYPAEYAQTGPNVSLLRQVADETGGRFFEDAASAWNYRPSEAPATTNLAPLCLLLGLALFVLDIAWRRLGWRVRVRRPATARISAMAEASRSGARSARAQSSRPEPVAPWRKRGTPEQDDAVFLSRSVDQRIARDDADPPIDDPFPLVASLDEKRRRERAQKSDRPR
jgi:Ca-activated chloride channel homolog